MLREGPINRDSEMVLPEPPGLRRSIRLSFSQARNQMPHYYFETTYKNVVTNVCFSLFSVLICYLFTLYDVKEEFTVNRKNWILKVIGSIALIKLCNLGIALLQLFFLCLISSETVYSVLMLGNMILTVLISLYIQYLFVASFFINDGVPSLP